MVTHLTTNLPLPSLNMREQTGPLAFWVMWSYVTGSGEARNISCASVEFVSQDNSHVCANILLMSFMCKLNFRWRAAKSIDAAL